ncbi:fibroblast growth factor receptor substrate 2-like isoform X1 [Astyanax mexicanus]|uniref:Fibroblast growth factor receptor substrate 2 n=1 Tax=Astyanax mexicanus TaxID=7994 RepID=A0A8B9HJP6_ASTMX|nr:fibroblast growth factor receptor substrate 2-like isoform X1 [Astyanax mexicanus]
MGICISCPQKENIADNHHSKFKVINVDDDGNELGSGVMELTGAELILHTRKRDAVNWPYLCLRRYGYDSNLFSFESGRRCQTGQGIFAFKCVRAEEIFNMLQEIMHNNSISVVEEPVLEPEFPIIPHSHTTPLYSVPVTANGVGRFSSVSDGSSQPCSRLPSVESTHPLLMNDEMVHTYINTPGLQEEYHSQSSGHAPLDLLLSNSESVGSASLNESEVVWMMMEPESVKFVLAPTPVQRQMMLKEKQREHKQEPPAPEQTTVTTTQSIASAKDCTNMTLDPDTGYDSDERKEAPLELKNGLIFRRPRPSNTLSPISPAYDTYNRQHRTAALLNYENLPALMPVWELRKPPAEVEMGTEHKNPAQNRFDLSDPQHNYINTENAEVPSSTHKLGETNVFSFDLQRVPAADTFQQLNYIEVEMDKVSDSSGPQTPSTPPTPLPETPTHRTEFYAVIDIERTAAMSSLQRAQPRDDGTARKTRHNSTDLPM